MGKEVGSKVRILNSIRNEHRNSKSKKKKRKKRRDFSFRVPSDARRDRRKKIIFLWVTGRDVSEGGGKKGKGKGLSRFLISLAFVWWPPAGRETKGKGGEGDGKKKGLRVD